ncbi:putative defense protein 3 [Lytechinus pictus]|uniref:putative defense protein 3 n=1 Tax=Lytechinus pictus TaxID=7653 RepID=UPI0030B9E23C
MYFWCLAFLAVVHVVTAYPSGAPAGTCTTLTPGHRDNNNTMIQPQTGQSPYVITIDKKMYSPSEMLKVTITGQSFKGILLQARRSSDNTVIGTFSDPPANTKPLECTSAGDSITHSSRDEKSSGTQFTWTAPSSDVGNITFIATVVQEYNVFWTNLLSQEVYSGATMVSINPGLIFTLICMIFLATRQ